MSSPSPQVSRPPRREGLNISGTGVITINIDMPVSGVQETITVTGETPVVDVSSTRREITLDNETMRNLPACAATATC